MRSERSPYNGFPPLPLFLRLRLTADREALVRWVYSVSFIIYCSLSFAFSFLSFCLLSPSLLRQSVPSSLISAQFGGALLEACNLQCRAFVNKLWAGHSPGSCENITLLQFKHMFFKEYLSWDLIWFTKFDSWASAVYIPALGLCVSLLKWTVCLCALLSLKWQYVFADLILFLCSCAQRTIVPHCHASADS